ncbi:FAD-dependent oxidoreductase [Chitinimonas arctica]|uniref:FAD-dependent oxidoreductase n=1 Tax=Chitinimonas arctica TaxID=2594795 RepID=A0A516SEE6_9NEIS|nr:FAD-dependent oxidoreductase [Chitinimonas arctica]QDQ26526.1 FAD-dependent oxidoreductase [Chitinimonas arctica]
MTFDLLIIGAGIIGSALAESCARRGLRVLVLEAGIPAAGTTSAGMGHLVVLDDNPAELALSRDGLQRWQARRDELPPAAEYRNCGTLWLARDEEELAEAERKQACYRQYGLTGNLLNARQLQQQEPALAKDLAGGLQVPGEAVIYPPAASAYLLSEACRLGAQLVRGCAVSQLSDEGWLRLVDGREFSAPRIVVAAGNQSTRLLPGLPLKPRKGQLLITERYPATISHQLVELGYIRSAHASDADSVAFNLQPRATGQLLLGSSRQYQDQDSEIDWPLLRRMLSRAFDYLPGLAELQAIRAWSGFRPATPDKLPLLGPVPGKQRLWLATGHEGLGITTALSSAELLADLLCDCAPTLDPRPYDPARFGFPTAVQAELAELTP